MARWSGFVALAVLGLMLVAANAEVFFQEDFTGVFMGCRVFSLPVLLFYWACVNGAEESIEMRATSLSGISWARNFVGEEALAVCGYTM